MNLSLSSLYMKPFMPLSTRNQPKNHVFSSILFAWNLEPSYLATELRIFFLFFLETPLPHFRSISQLDCSACDPDKFPRESDLFSLFSISEAALLQVKPAKLVRSCIAKERKSREEYCKRKRKILATFALDQDEEAMLLPAHIFIGYVGCWWIERIVGKEAEAYIMQSMRLVSWIYRSFFTIATLFS